jgi:hypothetical protein
VISAYPLQGSYIRAKHCGGCAGLSARPSGGKTVAARSQAKLQALKPRKGLKEDFAYLFTFSDISNAGMLITIST